MRRRMLPFRFTKSYLLTGWSLHYDPILRFFYPWVIPISHGLPVVMHVDFIQQSHQKLNSFLWFFIEMTGDTNLASKSHVTVHYKVNL